MARPPGLKSYDQGLYCHGELHVDIFQVPQQRNLHHLQTEVVQGMLNVTLRNANSILDTKRFLPFQKVHHQAGHILSVNSQSTFERKKSCFSVGLEYRQRAVDSPGRHPCS